MIPAPTVTHDIIEHWTLSHEIREAILHWYGERAAAVDRAELPTEEGVLHAARSGWLGFGIPRRLGGHGDDLTPMIEVLALAARSCFASAFALWSQRMLAAYLAGSENGFLREEILPLVLRGERFGSTGLANAMRHVVGLEPLGLRASWVGDDLVVNGRLPWASNLVPEAFIVAIAAATEDGRGVLTAVPAEIPGLVREDDFSLVALDATATTAVRFESARISRHWLISDDLGAFLGGVRPTFLLLQCGFCWGLAEAALLAAAGARDVVAREVLANELHGLRHALGGLVRRIRGLCDVQHWGVREARDLLQVRLDAVTLAVDAAWVELTALGGAAYRKTGPTARRLREAAFLPIQAPTVVQLRWELARLAEGSGQ